jgi:hypothetical protein
MPKYILGYIRYFMVRVKERKGDGGGVLSWVKIQLVELVEQHDTTTHFSCFPHCSKIHGASG